MSLEQDAHPLECGDINSEKTQLRSLVAVCVLFIGIGVPVWWKTTEVYHAVLPYEEIFELNNKYSLTINIPVLIENFITDFDAESFADKLQETLHQNDTNSMVEFHYKVTASSSNVDDQSQNIYNMIKIVLALKNSEKVSWVITDNRVVYCYMNNRMKSDKNNFEDIVLAAKSIIVDVMVKEKIVNEAVLFDNRSGAMHRNQDSVLRKAVKNSPKFDLLFSLLCPDPDNVLVNWNIHKSVNSLLQRTIKKLEPIFDFDIGSQILYYVTFPFLPMKQKVNGSVIHYLNQDQLSHVVNPIETKLGSQSSSNPTINFVVYVTEKTRTPLYIRKDDLTFSRTNAFLVPRWGAMMFYNIKDVNNEAGQRKPVLHDVDMNLVICSFMDHFRTLIGVPSLSKHLLEPNIVLQPSKIGLAEWEIDYLMRIRSVENLATAIHTLHSLSELLNQIHNIVINDKIAEDVYAAVNAIKAANDYARLGNISEVLRLSKIAMVASETAFFDPTLLELLYFPQDQKFAIYVPLFLPISLPILISIFKVFRRFKQSRKIKSE